MRLFVEGRKSVFKTLSEKIKSTDKTLWFHCASLGEFEQGLPIMEAVKKEFPDHKMVVSFFSPSGFEVKKNAPIADAIVYLPLDTKSNAKKFVEAVHPSIAFFVKYEFWPNYLFELKKRSIPTLLVSGLFRENQIFFKPHGKFLRKALHTFRHIFVQNENSKKLLNGIGLENVSVSGDTRFDRVSHQIEQDNSLPFIEAFLGGSLCVVCGSTWPEDEAVLLETINTAKHVKFIIAPHKIEGAKIEAFRKKIKKSTVLFSEKENENLSKFDVLIVDTIGLLTKIYSYADVAYVGGAMGNTGLHNILEAATFGVPIIIGQHYENFPEAERLQQLAGLFSVSTSEECKAVFNKLIENDSFRKKTGMIAEHFVNRNTGATRITMDYVEKLHRDGLV